MKNENDVKAVIIEMMEANELFTSVDIANQVKREGIFIRNRKIAKYLRDNWFQIAVYHNYNYKVEQIMVGENQDVSALLYLPNSATISDYTITNQKSISRKEFEKMNDEAYDDVYDDEEDSPTDSLDVVEEEKDVEDEIEEDIKEEDIKEEDENEEDENEEDENEEEEQPSDPFMDSSGMRISLNDFIIYCSSKTGKVSKGFVSKIYIGKTGKPFGSNNKNSSKKIKVSKIHIRIS